MSQFVNPLSSTTVRTNQSMIDFGTPVSQFTIGEVVKVEYGGPQLGMVKYRHPGNTDRDPNAVPNMAVPLFANLKTYPVAGEYVLLITMGSTYYIPLNVRNNPISNISRIVNNTTTNQALQDTGKILANNKTFTTEGKLYLATSMLEGDIAFEGRFGQSIKFGSTVKLGNEGLTPWSLSDLSTNGDPITIIRNGINNPMENISDDDASIYLCSTQRIKIDTGINGFEGITSNWSTLSVSEKATTITADPFRLTKAQLNQLKAEAAKLRGEIKSQTGVDLPNTPGGSGALPDAVANNDNALATVNQLDHVEEQIKSKQSTYVEAGNDAVVEKITPTSAEADLCKRIVAIAQEYNKLKITSVPPGYRKGPYIDDFNKYNGFGTGSDGKGAHWCANFVSYVYNLAGADHPKAKIQGKDFPLAYLSSAAQQKWLLAGAPGSKNIQAEGGTYKGLRPNSAWVPYWHAWGIDKGVLSKTPVPGAALIYYGARRGNYEADPRYGHGYGHIGIVESVDTAKFPAAGSITTIEGNIGNASKVGRCYPNPAKIAGYIIPTANGKFSASTGIPAGSKPSAAAQKKTADKNAAKTTSNKTTTAPKQNLTYSQKLKAGQDTALDKR